MSKYASLFRISVGCWVLFEPDNRSFPAEVKAAEGLIEVREDGTAHIAIENVSGFTQVMDADTVIGHGFSATPTTCGNQLLPKDRSEQDQRRELYEFTQQPHGMVQKVQSKETVESTRKDKLLEVLNIGSDVLNPQDREKFCLAITNYHNAFSLSEAERGETDLVEMTIDTGDAPPKRQPLRRVPFAIRKELGQQLESIERNNVIQPSSSPWASPIVLVRKKDRSLRLCRLQAPKCSHKI